MTKCKIGHLAKSNIGQVTDAEGDIPMLHCKRGSSNKKLAETEEG